MIYHGARRNGKSEAIRIAARLADKMGCHLVVAALYGIQTAEDRANADAIEIEVIPPKPEPKGLIEWSRDAGTWVLTREQAKELGYELEDLPKPSR